MIKRNPTNPENGEVVEDQLAEIDRMDALLSDLLVLARLDAEWLDVEKKPFDLSAVAAETAGRFLKRASEEGIRLEIEVPDDLPARGDPRAAPARSWPRSSTTLCATRRKVAALPFAGVEAKVGQRRV